MCFLQAKLAGVMEQVQVQVKTVVLTISSMEPTIKAQIALAESHAVYAKKLSGDAQSAANNLDGLASEMEGLSAGHPHPGSSAFKETPKYQRAREEVIGKLDELHADLCKEVNLFVDGLLGMIASFMQVDAPGTEQDQHR